MIYSADPSEPFLVKTILILAANPGDSLRLRLDKEVGEIAAGLERSRYRDRIWLKQHWATRPQDIQQAMHDYQPQIVHFCGHGTGAEGLVFEGESGDGQLVSTAALAELFALFAEQLDCVVLNACYTQIQAQAIAEHIDYAIGTKQAIGDRAAIKFAIGFYQALGAGHSFERAYEFGCNAIHIAGMSPASDPANHKRKPATTERQLHQLIQRVCRNRSRDSWERRKTIADLIGIAKKLPGLAKYSHPHYPNALDETWLWFSRNICNFEARPDRSIQISLVQWINAEIERQLQQGVSPETHPSPLRLGNLDPHIDRLRSSNDPPRPFPDPD